MKAKEFQKIIASIEGKLSEAISEIESLHDELQESLDNMPEQFQESSPLNEKIEALEEWLEEIEGSYPG